MQSIRTGSAKSAPMVRKDSGMAHSTSPPVHKMRAIPGPQKKTVTFAPTPPGTGSRRYPRFQPEAPAFEPATIPISMLNTDSVPDVASEHGESYAANTGKPMRQTSSRSSPVNPRPAGTIHLGPAFSTDVDLRAGACSRYLVLGNVGKTWVHEANFKSMLDKCGILHQLAGIQVTDVLGRYEGSNAYLWFDDLRDAKAAPQKYRTVFARGDWDLVDDHTYWAVDYKNPEAKDSTYYDGQIEFAAYWIAPEERFNLRTTFDEIRTFAATFGEIRTIAVTEGATPTKLTFRVEYFSLAAATKACEPDFIKEFIDLTDDLVVTIKPYDPYNLYEFPYIMYLPPPPPYVPGPRLRGPKFVRPEHRRPPNNHGLHTSQIPFNVAPEYRNAIINPNYVRPIPSGIHTLPIDRERLARHYDIRNQPQTVTPEKINAGQDCRTTVMIRNIPNKLNAIDLKDWLDITSLGKYDFSYLRIDFSNNCNVGYAFVNFTKPEHIASFYDARVGKLWRMFNSEKTCEISYATIQGYECLIAKFRNSSVMREWAMFRPRVFYSELSHNVPAGKRIGDQYDFPPSDNGTKLRRSLDNAQAVGLYPPRSHGARNNFPGGRSQYDRGTPR